MKKYSFLYFLPFMLIFCHWTGYAQNIKPTQTEAVFNVVTTSKSGNPRQGEVISLVSQGSKKRFTGTTGEDGKCTIIIPSGEKYIIYYQYFSDQVKYKDLDVPGGDHRVTYTFTMKYDPPRTFTLKNVFFDTGKATLRKESDKALLELAEVLKLKPRMEIEIAGHTDNVGSSESNIKLSADRAEAVRIYLINKGINGNRIVAKGYGETQPVADNNTEEGKQQNRRTEVRIIKD
ncbi:MAG: OmpA family protein [Bacteroidales bacterium]|nr:OmpA family protein [Bacteroidales bacterium]